MSDHQPAIPADGEYQPDPDAESRMVIEAFVTALAGACPDQPDLAARVARRHEQLLAAHQHRIIDPPSRSNLAMTLAVLAADQELAPHHDRADRLRLLETAFVEPLSGYIRSGTAAALDAADDPFALMVQISRDRERDSFGAGFDFAHPADDAGHYVAEVHRCYFHEVLVANDAPHLTPVLCAWDANWIEAIDPDRHGFAFDRPTTIGTGGASCPFAFRRLS